MRCERPQRTCICAWISPTPNRVELVILQHPLEVHNAKNTAGLLHLSLHSSQLHVGEKYSCATLRTLLAHDQKLNVLLYPATVEAEALGLIVPPPMPALAEYAPEQLRLIVIDGTWRKSRKLLYLNPELQRLPRLSLTHCPASRYHIRTAQGQDQLSTLEASCYALQQLEAESVNYQPLLSAFDGFIAQQLAFTPHHPLSRAP